MRSLPDRVREASVGRSSAIARPLPHARALRSAVWALCLLALALAAVPAHAREAPGSGVPRAAAAALSRAAGHVPAAAATSRGAPLTVALFPWVPRPRQVEDVIAAAWRQQHPNVPLKFVFWDCYASDPPPGLDLFVFDAVYLDRYVRRGLVQPIAATEIRDAADLLPYALRGARAAPTATDAAGARASTSTAGALYGVPQYGCASLLFYRRGDRALERATTLSDVVRALGVHTYRGLRPPPGTGLLVDLSDPTADGCRYLEALEDTYGVYTADPPLAPTANKLDPWALGDVRLLLRMSSRREADHASGDPFRRARWFGRGLGRALLEYSEGMSVMGRAAQATTEFKLMPFSNRGQVPLFYVDLVGVSPRVGTGERRTLALDLANLMTSTEVMVKAIGPWRGRPSPQYLFAVRRSVYLELAPRFPLYARMYALIGGSGEASGEPQPQPFRLGAGASRWFHTVGPVIKRRIFAAR